MHTAPCTQRTRCTPRFKAPHVFPRRRQVAKLRTERSPHTARVLRDAPPLAQPTPRDREHAATGPSRRANAARNLRRSAEKVSRDGRAGPARGATGDLWAAPAAQARAAAALAGSSGGGPRPSSTVAARPLSWSFADPPTPR
eukprot:864726-Prymnesium_polylepis.1